jgi:hypothetical protein
MGRYGKLKKNLKKLLPVATVTLTVGPFAAWSPTADAFFPPVWPISPPVTVVPPTSPPPVVVVPPVSPPPITVPPVSPPPIIVPPVSPPPIVIPPVQPPPITTTPEPATLVTGLIGLAAAAGYRLKRRGEKKDESKE